MTKNDLTISQKQIKAVRELLLSKSWSNSASFEAYQDAWNIVAHLLGVTASTNDGLPRHTVAKVEPSTLCHCLGSLPSCKECNGKGYILPNRVKHDV